MPPAVWCQSGSRRGSSVLETETAIGNFTSLCVNSRSLHAASGRRRGNRPRASRKRAATGPYIARLSRASLPARSGRRNRSARSSPQSPPFLVFQRVGRNWPPFLVARSMRASRRARWNRRAPLARSASHSPPFFVFRQEDGGAGRGPHASGPRPAPHIAPLSRASAPARSEQRNRSARSSPQSPPFLVIQRMAPLGKGGMLRKHRVSAKTRPCYRFTSKRALMLWRT